MHMVMFILDESCHLDAVLEAWAAIGINEVTVVESTGIQQRQVQRGRIPLRFHFGQPLVCSEEHHYTVFVIVKGEEWVRKCIAAAEEVVGNLDQPHTGVVVSWPLAVVKGGPGDPESSSEAS